ncbi:type II toxin-antitoxin system PemK/MazF family toxin [Fortiea contorta]|uniref:type II toxin-antitoxin system PemK/MazF family toxin n=1 Tax=Fortiea contorta TaxID=1892405 RepID=UPI00034A52CC|nr:type II toxin-antitoxin system PemK/MazF family toxin [Fortiea contorta]
MNPKPGEVWLIDLGLAAKTRPVIIVSRDDPTPPRALILYVPITTQNRGSAYEVELPVLSFLRQGSIANIQGLGSVPSVRLDRQLGELSAETMLKIKQALIFTLDLEAKLQHDEH